MSMLKLKRRLIQLGLITGLVVVPSWLWFGSRYGMWIGLLNAVGITVLTFLLIAVRNRFKKKR